MEPVTHFLTGACIGRAGWNRKTAYATLAATLAAEAPDLDVVWGWRGPVQELAHHRGITHTLIAAPVMAAVVTGAVWLWHRYRARRHQNATSQPVRWTWVWLTALVADLSHLALDWANNYGVRPFFPFDRHWYAGSLIFIVEPALWLMLGLALLIPAILGLADREIGAKRQRFRGRGMAIAALCGVVLLGCWRWAEQADARNRLMTADVTPTPPLRVALEPYPWNPFRWHAILETATTWQTAEIDTRTGAVDSDPRTNALFKPPVTPAVAAAKKTRLGEVYLDWSQWPVVRDVGQVEVVGVPVGGAGPQARGGRRWSSATCGLPTPTKTCGWRAAPKAD
jgi:inner membrane protein